MIPFQVYGRLVRCGLERAQVHSSLAAVSRIDQSGRACMCVRTHAYNQTGAVAALFLLLICQKTYTRTEMDSGSLPLFAVPEWRVIVRSSWTLDWCIPVQAWSRIFASRRSSSWRTEGNPRFPSVCHPGLDPGSLLRKDLSGWRTEGNPRFPSV